MLVQCFFVLVSMFVQYFVVLVSTFVQFCCCFVSTALTNLNDMDDESVEHLADGGDVATQEDRHRPVRI